MAPLAIGPVNGHGGPRLTSFEPSIPASDRAAFERALVTVPPGLARAGTTGLRHRPDAATSPGDRILAGLQGSKSLASAETAPGSEDTGSVLAGAQARLGEAQAHLEQLEARLEQLESQREERFQARLERAQARLDKIRTLPEQAQAHLEKVEAHIEKMRAHFEEVEQRLLAKAQARVDAAQAYLEEVQAGLGGAPSGSADAVRVSRLNKPKVHRPDKVGISPDVVEVPPAAVTPGSAEPVGGYAQPFGPNASWNMPVTKFPRRLDSDTYRNRLWEIGSDRPGNFNLSFDQYTYPVYDAGTATMQAKVVVRNNWGSNLIGKTIPWNPNWLPSSGTDGQVIILDPATGREWDLWRVSYSAGTLSVGNGNLVPGSYWTNEQGFSPSRGAGIPYLAMLVRPEEIEAGVIRHALSMPAHNIDSSLFVAPATKTDGGTFGVPNGIPEGMRFALNVTDAEIDAWAAKLPLSDVGRRSARIIATALRDYGWIITDNAGSAHIQFEDHATAGAEWDALGLGTVSAGGKAYPRDLLDGLMLKERIYAVAHPSSPSVS
jgi:hypothetical protein